MLDAATAQQYRGLIHAWRSRPQWMRTPPSHGVQQVRHQTPLGLTVVSQRTYSQYSRFKLPTFPPLQGRGAYTNLDKRCRWCKQAIQDRSRRVWHQHCLHAYWAATSNQSALTNALRSQYRSQHDDQDPSCELCGLTSEQALANAHNLRLQAEQLRQHDAQPNADTPEKRIDSYRINNQRYHELASQAQLATRFELDHHDALGVAWASGDPRRAIRALTIANLQWLCHSCHASKTAEDRRAMNSLLRRSPTGSEHPLKTTEPPGNQTSQPDNPAATQATLWTDPPTHPA